MQNISTHNNGVLSNMKIKAKIKKKSINGKYECLMRKTIKVMSIYFHEKYSLF